MQVVPDLGKICLNLVKNLELSRIFVHIVSKGKYLLVACRCRLMVNRFPVLNIHLDELSCLLVDETRPRTLSYLHAQLVNYFKNLIKLCTKEITRLIHENKV